jgi:hypothetical protein
MTPEDILYKQFRNLPVFRSKKFIDWVHKKYGKCVHHLTGSQGRQKLMDYLVVPIDLDDHQKAEKEKEKYFINNLARSFSLLCEYLQEIGG